MVAVCGEIDLANMSQLETVFRGLATSELGEIVVDLRELTYLDSSVLRVLVRARAQISRQGVRLRLVPNDRVRFILHWTRLDERFELGHVPRVGVGGGRTD